MRGTIPSYPSCVVHLGDMTCCKASFPTLFSGLTLQATKMVPASNPLRLARSHHVLNPVKILRRLCIKPDPLESCRLYEDDCIQPSQVIGLVSKVHLIA